MNKHFEHMAAAALPLAVAASPPSRVRAVVDSRHDDLVRRVRGEYLEMPGLALTLGQAQRLWNLQRAECARLLGDLVDAGFLACTSLGTFVRADTGRAGA
jgi:hypothetical protein